MKNKIQFVTWKCVRCLLDFSTMEEIGTKEKPVCPDCGCEKVFRKVEEAGKFDIIGE